MRSDGYGGYGDACAAGLMRGYDAQGPLQGASTKAPRIGHPVIHCGRAMTLGLGIRGPSRASCLSYGTFPGLGAPSRVRRGPSTRVDASGMDKKKWWLALLLPPRPAFRSSPMCGGAYDTRLISTRRGGGHISLLAHQFSIPKCSLLFYPQCWSFLQSGNGIYTWAWAPLSGVHGRTRAAW